jgi:hypothetical protein
MKFKVLLAVGAALAMSLFAPAAAQASVVRPAASCFGYNYAYTINSYQIAVVITPACSGEGTTWAYLQRKNANGTWTYLTDTSSPPTTPQSIHYLCNGTATNTYELGPIFPVGGVNGGQYTFYTFTDNCG